MSSHQIIRLLLHHGWLSFRRAHYFERSLGVKLIMAFAGLIFLWYLYWIGMLLPVLLERFYPDTAPYRVFFSFLLYIYAADLLFRLFMQKVPRLLIQSYLPLPVTRNTLATFILIRSWFSIYNVYLLPLLIPFYIRSLLLPVSAAAFWLALLGTFLLGGINHAFIIWMKTWPSRFSGAIVALILIAGAGIFGGILFPYHFMAFSGQLGEAFISGNPVAFIIPLLIIVMLHTLSQKSLLLSFYEWAGALSVKVQAGSTLAEKLFARVPVHGLFWELEWKLIKRNKRASAGLRQWPLTIIGVPLLLYFAPGDSTTHYIYLMVMIAGGYGFYHLQYAYSWESRFFDLIASKKIDIYTFILSKYYFYCLLGLIQVIPLLALLAIARAETVLPMAGMFLYVTGPVFVILLNTGIGNSTRIDPNKRASFNFEGTSGTLFLTIFAAMFSVVFLMIFAYFLPLPIETGMALVTGATGIVFIVLHRRFIRGIANTFNKKKYRNLSKYREK